MNTQVRPPIDPRIRQRRIAVRRQEGRRRLRLLIGIGTVSGLLVGGWGATRSPLLDVDGIAVAGADRTSRDDLVAASGIRFGQAMVDVDERGAVQALAVLAVDSERHRRAAVARLGGHPHRRASAGRGRPGRRRMGPGRRKQGRSWPSPPRPPSNLLALDGIPPAGAPGTSLGGAAADLLAVAAAVPPDLRPRVSAVQAGSEGGVELRLQPEGTVRLGAAPAAGGEVPGSTHRVGPGRHQRPRHPRRENSRQPSLDAPQPCR